jgi:hypothetical protein
VKTYRNDKWGFTIALPKGWREPSWLFRLFLRRRQQREQPEFYGPYHSKMKFSIGPIHPIPEVVEQQKNLERMAMNHGYRVIDFDVIRVGGKDHAVMVFEASGIGEVKTYSLIFGSTEYLITAQGRIHEADYIVKSFRV